MVFGYMVTGGIKWRSDGCDAPFVGKVSWHQTITFKKSPDKHLKPYSIYMHNLHFTFVAHSQIDQQRWDECIRSSPAGLIYATSMYLNHMSPGWDGLVGGDYEWVMPIVSNKKFGIAYLYQPAFTQQLGVFTKHSTIQVPWKEILAFLQKKFSFWEISLNHSRPPQVFSSAFKMRQATNYILPLQDTYSALYNNFHKDHQRNITRSQKHDLVYAKMQNHAAAIDLYHLHYGKRMPHVSLSTYQRFKQLLAAAAQQNMLCCRMVVNQGEEILAAGVFLNDGKRLYNLANTTTANGRKVEANHYLFSALVAEFAGSNLLLDFEGSDLEGVSSFYQKFGAVNQPYFMVKHNKLPWPLRLFKG